MPRTTSRPRGSPGIPRRRARQRSPRRRGRHERGRARGPRRSARPSPAAAGRRVRVPRPARRAGDARRGRRRRCLPTISTSTWVGARGRCGLRRRRLRRPRDRIEAPRHERWRVRAERSPGQRKVGRRLRRDRPRPSRRLARVLHGVLDLARARTPSQWARPTRRSPRRMQAASPCSSGPLSGDYYLQTDGVSLVQTEDESAFGLATATLAAREPFGRRARLGRAYVVPPTAFGF